MLLYNLLDKYRRSRFFASFLNPDEFLSFARNEMYQFSSNYGDYVTQKTIYQEQCDMWHDMKIGRVTASSIYEATRCEVADGYLVNKILGYTSVTNSAMQRGLSLQSQVIDVVSQRLTTYLSKSGLILDAQNPIIGASPDAVAHNFVVEIKCPLRHENINYYVYPNSKSLRPKFYSQIQIQMYLKKVQYGFFVIACPNFEYSRDVNKMIRIDYNHEYTKKIIYDATVFWKENIFPRMLNNF